MIRRGQTQGLQRTCFVLSLSDRFDKEKHGKTGVDFSNSPYLSMSPATSAVLHHTKEQNVQRQHIQLELPSGSEAIWIK
jgi:hypothetical protein